MSTDSTVSTRLTSTGLITPVSISKRHPFISWLLAILTAMLGVYLSIIQFAGLEWLSRSGCLIVVLGIWSGLGGIIQERLLLSRLNFHHRIVMVRAKRKLYKLKVSSENIASEIQSIEDDFKEKTEKILQAVRLQLGILEVSLLITGTLLWGFGDLFFILLS
ncbi:hypothetical protein H4J46_05965 [Colwellia sp. MB02u-6]|uniref:hypothetical protein n=1 Tax=Colwellia sp. MB02u-6 TaxID=2759824 RepID=UPI0015F5C3D5|nr:hypothetical protein [Colwellia sp. MB02u-6]MBA6327489.1 hypothetical protein [Colwellia sp. MB02u-6]